MTGVQRSQPNIVDRLRNFCVWNNRQSHYEPVPLTSEAADEIDRLRAELASARKALEDCLPCMGWSNYSDDELREETALGNGFAPIILQARAALKDQPK